MEMEDELTVILRQIKQQKHSEIAMLNDRLQKLDREMADADLHIRDQIRAMVQRAEVRRQDIVEGLEDLRATLTPQLPPPLPHVDNETARLARRYAPETDSIRSVVEDSYDWANDRVN